MPNPLSWYFHHLPKPLHRVEAAGNHVVQLAVPFALFLPQPVASIAASLMIATQLWLCLSGNFAWLNWITLVLACSVVDGSWWAAVVPVEPPTMSAPSWFVIVTVLLFALVAVLSYRPGRNLISSHQAMNASFDKLHLVNTYGAFGHVTRARSEIVLEGTDDPTVKLVGRNMIQGQTGQSGPAATTVRAVSPAPGLVDVVRRDLLVVRPWLAVDTAGPPPRR